jgi:hypothetical protein
LNLILIVPDPNIWKYILLLKQEEATANLKIIAIEKGVLKSRGRNKLDVIRDLEISNLKLKYLLNEISYEDLFLKLSN